jgi:succinyl-CoA synthetase beta subunit
VRAILVNVFGGIVRCDDVARGVLGALGRVQLASPIVVRLDGTHAAAAHALLEPHLSDRLVMAPTMLAAARRAVELAAGAGR